MSEPPPPNNERKFAALVSSVRDYAIFMLDANGCVETWNLGARAIKGYTPEEIIGKPIDTFYTQGDREAGHPKALLARARAEGRVEDIGWRVRKDGTRFYADVVITALWDENGTLTGYAKVTRDLTERREAELERERLVQAQEAIRLRDDFLSIASHELRTPLMALQLQIDNLLQLYGGTDPKLDKKLERTDRSVRRLAELVGALLDVTRISTGRLTLHPQEADLAEVVIDVCERMEEAADRAAVKLTTQIESGIVGAWDSLRMDQVVTNLLSNAFTYASKAPVELTLTTAGDRVTLVVRDHGPGIASEDAARIFGRFERASDARHYGGLGLGLYVAQQIVHAHGGTIGVRNGDAGGATFTIDLPRRGIA